MYFFTCCCQHVYGSCDLLPKNCSGCLSLNFCRSLNLWLSKLMLLRSSLFRKIGCFTTYLVVLVSGEFTSKSKKKRRKCSCPSKRSEDKQIGLEWRTCDQEYWIGHFSKCLNDCLVKFKEKDKWFGPSPWQDKWYNVTLAEFQIQGRR